MTRQRFLTDSAGSTIVEFAVAAPIVLMVIWGGISLSMAGFSAANLRYATQAAARCAAVQTTVCADEDSTRAYAVKQFTPLTDATATFAVEMEAMCGKRVTGNQDYVVQTGVGSITVPLSSSACFPQ